MVWKDFSIFASDYINIPDSMNTDLRHSEWQQMMDNLIHSLRELPNGANTPLALNLKMLSLLADMEHTRKLLKALYEQWRTELPFITERGMEVDWDAVRLQLTMRSSLQTVGEGVPFPHVIVNAPPPEGVKWRWWQRELRYERPSGETKDIFSEEYGRMLNPTLNENVWYVTADFIKRYSHKRISENGDTPRDWEPFTSPSFSGLRETMCHLSPKTHDKLVQCLRGEVSGLIQMCQGIDLLLRSPREHTDNSDVALASLYDRLYARYITAPASAFGTVLRRELDSWCELYGHDGGIAPSQTLGKRAVEFGLLYKSHFITPWVREQGLEGVAPECIQSALHRYFFDSEGRVRREVAGAYIFAYQRTMNHWEQCVKDFLRYVYVCQYLDEAEELFLKVAVKQVKDSRLLDNDADWIAVFCVLNERYRLFGKEDYAAFYHKMRDMGFEPFTKKSEDNVTDSLRKAYANVGAFGPTTKWREALADEEKHNRGRALKRYLAAAEKLKNILGPD